MSREYNPNLTAEQAIQLIADVDDAELKKARLAISEAVSLTQGQWIQADIVAQALVLELAVITRNNLPNKSAAAYLRKLATMLEQQPDLH